MHWSSADGDPPIRITPSHLRVENTPIAVRGSCNVCGSPLFMKYHCRPDATSVVMGIMDDATVVGSMPAPKEHIFWGEKAAWFKIGGNDGLAKHEACLQKHPES